MKRFSYLVKNLVVFTILFSILFSIFLLQNSRASNCETKRDIVYKPITFNEQRKELTRKYQLEHYGISSSSIKINPKIIVLHWTDTASLEQAFALFNPTILASDRTELSGQLNVSSHFLVDRDGTIYQLMPVNWMARHVYGLNHIAIGIENVGGASKALALTAKQVAANAYLICQLKKEYPQIKYLIGHQDSNKFRNTPLWLERDQSYHFIKTDPGHDFIEKVNILIKHLGLITP